MGLGNRTVKAAAWLYGLRIVTRVLSLVRTVILARLLMPSDFGLIGIATLTVGILEVFTRSGLDHSVVQKTEVSRHELHAIWSFDVLRGVVLGTVMFLAAPYIGAFMNSPGSVPVIRAMSVIPPLVFLRNIDLVVIWKELEMQKMFFVEAAQLVASVLVGISLALLCQNVWALVASELVGRLVWVAMSYLVSPSRPRFIWDWPVIRYHFRYGRQSLATAIAYYLYTNVDDWFVGKAMGESALGLYSRAYSYGNLPTTELTRVLARVLFPSFSKLKDDTIRLRNAVLRVQRMLSLLVAPITAFLFFFAQPCIHALLGDKWLPMVPAFRILVLWGGLQALYSSVGSLFRAVGRQIITAYFNFAKLALMIVLLWPARQYGIAGVGTIVFFTSLLEFPVLMWFTARQLKVPYVSLYRPLLLPSIVAFSAGLATFLINMGENALTRLLWGLSGTIGGYLLVMVALEYVFHLTHFAEARHLWSLVRAKVD